MLSAEQRLAISIPPKSIRLATDPPNHPIHFLLRNDGLEKIISNRFREAFGVDLIVHRCAGASVPLHVGAAPKPDDGDDRVSFSYVTRLEQLPTLETQGDGMRSFAGVLLSISAGEHSMLLIDEPEAFLHPPHARQLGLALAGEKAKDRQLFIATHSTDVLRGVIDGGNESVTVVRLTRSGNDTVARVLDKAQVGKMWSDSLLRYSNILDGLFHDGVVVCESDCDCRFYRAVSDSLYSEECRKRPDLMFTHVGGKHRLDTAVGALRAVGVPVCAIADFDIVSEEQPLKKLAELLGAAGDVVR